MSQNGFTTIREVYHSLFLKYFWFQNTLIPIHAVKNTLSHSRVYGCSYYQMACSFPKFLMKVWSIDIFAWARNAIPVRFLVQTAGLQCKMGRIDNTIVRFRTDWYRKHLQDIIDHDWFRLSSQISQTRRNDRKQSKLQKASALIFITITLGCTESDCASYTKVSHGLSQAILVKFRLYSCNCVFEKANKFCGSLFFLLRAVRKKLSEICRGIILVVNQFWRFFSNVKFEWSKVI